jgi:hypothetical protein
MGVDSWRDERCLFSSPKRPDRLGFTPTLLSLSTGVLFVVQSGWSVKQTVHFYLALRLRISGAVPSRQNIRGFDTLSVNLERFKIKAIRSFETSE